MKFRKNSSFKLILLRHGESKWNAANLYTGWYDIDLTQKGLIKSGDVGEILNKLDLSPKIIFTSEQKRAINTSMVVRNTLKESNIPIITNWRLNERHYGLLTGLNKLNYPFKSHFYEMPPEVERENCDTILKNIPSYTSKSYFAQINKGESLYQVHKRLIPYFYQHILPFKQDIMIVSHKNTLETLIKHIEKIEDKDNNRIDIVNSSPIIYDVIIDNCNNILFTKSAINV